MTKSFELNAIVCGLNQVATDLVNLSNLKEINFDKFQRVLDNLDVLSEKGYLEQLSQQLDDDKWFETYDKNNDLLHRLNGDENLNSKILFEIGQNFLNLANQLQKKLYH